MAADVAGKQCAKSFFRLALGINPRIHEKQHASACSVLVVLLCTMVVCCCTDRLAMASVHMGSKMQTMLRSKVCDDSQTAGMSECACMYVAAGPTAKLEHVAERFSAFYSDLEQEKQQRKINEASKYANLSESVGKLEKSLEVSSSTVCHDAASIVGSTTTAAEGSRGVACKRTWQQAAAEAARGNIRLHARNTRRLNCLAKSSSSG